MKKVKSIIAIAVVAFLFTSMITAQSTGKEIFLNSKCNTCHAIKSQDITSKQADKYPDLSNFGNADLSKEDAIKYLNKEFDIKGKKHPVKFKGSKEDLSVLIEWLLTLKENE